MSDQRRGDTDLPERVSEGLDELDRDTTSVGVATVLRLFREEYVSLANRNRRHIAEISNAYRRLLRGVMVAGLVYAAVQIGLGVLGYHLQVQSSNTITSVQSGRHLSLGVTCAVQSAVAQAGRQVIAGSSTPPPAAQEAALERFGFPPFKKRHAEAELAAQQYVLSITRSIHKQIGHKGDKLVNHDGTINCKQLATLAKIG